MERWRQENIIRAAFGDVISEVVAVMLNDGAGKHGILGWLDGRSHVDDVEHAKEHIDNWERGDDEDPDSGKSPLTHAIARLMCARSQEIEGVGIDDRHTPKACAAPGCTADVSARRAGTRTCSDRCRQRLHRAHEEVGNLPTDAHDDNPNEKR